MKKVLVVFLLLLSILFCNIVTTFGEPAIIGSVSGSAGATGTWDGVHPKEAAGDSLKMCYSGDAFGYQFKNVPAGVYKIAHYITLDSMTFGKRIRISPRVTYRNSQIRCWVDWYTVDVIAKTSDALGADKGKIILVSVINIPKDNADIDVGFWQDTGAYIGTLDKVVLASADYDFQNEDYLLFGEKSYDADHVFNEDPEQQLLAPADGWVASTEAEHPTAVPQITAGASDANATMPAQTEKAIPPALIDHVQTGLLIAIVAVVVIGVVGVVILCLWRGKDKIDKN